MKDTLRVGYVLGCFPVLSETFVLNEIKALTELGIQVSCFSVFRPEQDPLHKDARIMTQSTVYGDPLWCAQHLGPHLLTLASCPRGYRRLLAANQRYGGKRLFLKAVHFAGIIKQRKIRHIHTHFGWHGAYCARMVSYLLGVPYSMTLHASDIFVSPAEELPELIKNARFCATISQFNRKHVIETYGDDALRKVQVVRTGVDLKMFHPAPIGRSGQRPLRMLTVSRLVAVKNLPMLLAVCRRLKTARYDIECIIVGDGPERERIQRLIVDYHLQAQVFLEGAVAQEQLPSVYREADIFILTSLTEGLPVVLMEAMASGLPAVAPRIRGIPELVEHGRSGLLFPPGDVDAAVECVGRLARRPALRSAMGRAANQRVQEGFDLRDSARKLASMFTAVTNQPRVRKRRPARNA